MSNLPEREQMIMNMLKNSGGAIAVWTFAAELSARGDPLTTADCIAALHSLVEREWIQQASGGEHLYELAPLRKKS